ncbi:MAG TPA: DNA polymerase Y family protein [Trinickia sp.]|nr:DNA polymerase Y family protein [Trinickia sp.]
MLWIAVTLPMLSLEAVKPAVLASAASANAFERQREIGEASGRLPPDASVVCCYALADRLRIVLPDIRAYRRGVRVGQTRSSALAMAPDLVMLAPDPERERQAFEAVALALLAYTPKVSLAPARTLLLEVGSGLRLFGGLRALLTKITGTVGEFGCTSRIACAPTAWGAWLLAQARVRRVGRRWHVVQAATLACVLDALPVSLVPAAAAHGEAFERIGCETLADLRRLPRAGLARRFGDDVLHWLAQTYGEAPDPRESFRAPDIFQARLELQARVDSAEALLFAARRLLMQLVGWLTAHHAAVRGYTLVFEHDLAARHAGRTSSVALAWAEPSRDAEHLSWLLREKLQQTVLVAPVVELRLIADQVSEYAAPSDTLFPLPDADRDSVGRLLERLSARLGADNVMQISVQADPRPEKAMHAEPCQRARLARAASPAQEKRARAKRLNHGTGAANAGAMNDPASAQAARLQSDKPGELELPDRPVPGQPRPVWLLDAPLALTMQGQRPVYRRALTMLTRTERIEAGWWDGQGVERDYFIAADDRGRMFWVFRERRSGQWFLHGLFG